MTEQPNQLSLDDEAEDFGAWLARIPKSPLTPAERERIRQLVDRRRREVLGIPIEPKAKRRKR